MSGPCRDLERNPDPHRAPRGLLAVMIHWRVELVAGAGLGLFWESAGGIVVGMIALTTALAALATPSIRRAALWAWLFTAMPHRVRVALVDAAVRDRHGNLPWILWAIPSDTVVRVEIGRRAGTRVEDLEAAASLVAEACGAAGVTVVARPDRPDRATIILARPRWGLP